MGRFSQVDHDQATLSAGGHGEQCSPEALRRRVEAAVSGLLARRAGGSAQVVLGAGNDDLAPGRALLAKLAPGGFVVPTWPLEHGGMGLDPREAEVVEEVLGGFETADLYPFMVGITLVGPAILEYGNHSQKIRWLPRILDGSEIWCQLFSEPDAGSDLAALSTRAWRSAEDAKRWLVSGSKVWTSRAHYSKWGLLLARTDPSVPKHSGITAFALDMESPGVTVRPLVQMNGDRHFNQVFLQDVVIDDCDRIGAAGEGWAVAVTCLSRERRALAGDQSLSVEHLLSLGTAGDANGDRLARDRLCRAYGASKVLAWSRQRASATRNPGAPPGPEGSAAKLLANRTLKEVADMAMSARGARATVYEGGKKHTGTHGDSAESPVPDEWQALFLLSPSLSIRGGTDEIQKNILGERVLGLMPEPRVEKGRPFGDTQG